MTSMRISGIGHAVLRVRDLGPATDFYVGVLGLRAVAERDFGEGPMRFLSTGDSHHDLALVEIGTDAPRPAAGSTGLHHLALRIGNDLEALRVARDHLEAHGVDVHMALDHHVSQGIYVSDPDDHLLELYVDAGADLWRADPSLVANSDPLPLPL